MSKKIEESLTILATSKANYWGSFIYNTALSIIFAAIGFLYGADILLGAVTFIIGFFFFTLVEYFAHSKLFHSKLKSFKSLSVPHAGHHINHVSYDALPYFLPMILIIPLGLISYLFLSFELMMVFTGGIFLGYVTYGMMHHLVHRYNFNNSYFQYMKRFHDLHHTKPKINYGVTVPIWDMLFKTFLSVKKSV